MKSTMAITHDWLVSIQVRVEPVTGFTDTASRPIHLFLIQLIQTLTIEFNCDVIAQRDGQLPATIGSTAAIPRIFPTRHYSHCVKHDSSAAGTCKNKQTNRKSIEQITEWIGGFIESGSLNRLWYESMHRLTLIGGCVDKFILRAGTRYRSVAWQMRFEPQRVAGRVNRLRNPVSAFEHEQRRWRRVSIPYLSTTFHYDSISAVVMD